MEKYKTVKDFLKWLEDTNFRRNSEKTKTSREFYTIATIRSKSSGSVLHRIDDDWQEKIAKELREILINATDNLKIKSKNSQIELRDLKAYYWDKLSEIIDDPDARSEDDEIFWNEIIHQRNTIADLIYLESLEDE